MIQNRLNSEFSGKPQMCGLLHLKAESAWIDRL
jgi:hypothetical protein